MAGELLRDLPGDLPTFLARFGTDAQCRAYLARDRWPEGFRCAGCGHERAYSHRRRLIEECAPCGRQHSLLAGTIFEQTKIGLSRWFLAIWLVTSSKGGISASGFARSRGGMSAEPTGSSSSWAFPATRPPLRRPADGACSAAGSTKDRWSWLHKMRKAMVRSDRRALAERVEADETIKLWPGEGP